MTAAEADLAAEVERLRARITDLEAMEQDREAALAREAAVAEILATIARSPTNPQAVLDALLAAAMRLCDAAAAGFYRLVGDHLQMIAGAGGAAGISGSIRALTPENVFGVAVLEQRLIHVPDWSALPPDRFPESQAVGRQIDVATTIHVPLVRQGETLGVLFLFRRHPARVFTDAQLALVQTFADQAVIAIENARLFNELRESLEQQTATAEILSIISTSPTDPQPVFQAVAERAQRLLGADSAGIRLREGEELRFVAEAGPTLAVALGQSPGQRPQAEDSPLLRAVREARTVHVHGPRAALAGEYPQFAARWEQAGWERHRSCMCRSCRRGPR